MGRGHRSKSPVQEPSSDSSQSSTKALPPTGPNSPELQPSTILTRSRLTQVAMQANIAERESGFLLNVSSNGNRAADELRFQHFALQDDPRYPGRGQSQQSGQPKREISQEMSDELSDLDKKAYESRVKRVKKSMEAKDKSNQVKGKVNGTLHAAHSYHAFETPPSESRRSQPLEGPESIGSYAKRTEAPQPTVSSSTTHRPHEHTSSRRQSKERSRPRDTSPRRKSGGGSSRRRRDGF